jgi:hypothetical protein
VLWLRARTTDGPSPSGPSSTYPYDPDLFAELNVERYELSKAGRTLFNHAESVHDDRFWSLALTVHASETPPTSRPMAQTTG